MTAPEGVVDAIEPDGTHVYWSTYCRHAVLVEATDPPQAKKAKKLHRACSATEVATGVPRRPAQCKTCAAPCICPCHNTPDPGQ